MKPLVGKKYKLEKFPGKGGWTFVRIPEVLMNKKKPFGWVNVRGFIDGYEIRKYNMMPMGDGNLFLPVRAEIRKKIGKKEGDTVHITLYPDNNPLEIPEEMLFCLQDEPKALSFFNTLSDSEKKYYIEWIYSAKKEATKVDRLAKTIDRLVKGLKRFDKYN